MSLQIIKNDAKQLTKGEEKVFNRVKSIYKNVERDVYFYVQPTVGRLIPDFIIIDPNKGISILEIKDWSIDYIRNIDKIKVDLQDRRDDNPVYKTKKYLELVKMLIACSGENLHFMEYHIYGNTILTNISYEDIQSTEIGNELNQWPIKYITSNYLNKISVEDLFSYENIYISSDNIVNIRTLFFPEAKIKKEERNSIGDIIGRYTDILDVEQENFAKRLPYGHYMVTGIPGSGKTSILIARAIYLIKENPNWNIKILAYNKSLANKIESSLNMIAHDIKNNAFLRDIAIENISVTSFHKLALQITNVTVPKKVEQNWWDEVLPELALKKARPIYDAILIDEYQDFYDEWLKVCINLCKDYVYYNSANEEVEGINLFLAGDRLQSIYNSKENSWSDLGINMRGRSKLLKTSYRAGRENSTLALKFLQEHPKLLEEVKVFYKNEDDKKIEINNFKDRSNIAFLEGSYEEIGSTILELINKEGYNYNDILIICNTKYDCNKLKYCLPSSVKYNTKFVKDANDMEMRTCLLTSTYHSSKGLEAKIAILVDVDKFTNQLDETKDIMDRKLLYVGMTRASEQLFIHASNYNKDSFAQQLLKLYKTPVIV